MKSRRWEKKTNEIAAAAIEIQALDGYDFVGGEIDRAINGGAGAISDLF